MSNTMKVKAKLAMVQGEPSEAGVGDRVVSKLDEVLATVTQQNAAAKERAKEAVKHAAKVQMLNVGSANPADVAVLKRTAAELGRTLDAVLGHLSAQKEALAQAKGLQQGTTPAAEAGQGSTRPKLA